jgi:hypothetical protein
VDLGADERRLQVRVLGDVPQDLRTEVIVAGPDDRLRRYVPPRGALAALRKGTVEEWFLPVRPPQGAEVFLAFPACCAPESHGVRAKRSC